MTRVRSLKAASTTMKKITQLMNYRLHLNAGTTTRTSTTKAVIAIKITAIPTPNFVSKFIYFYSHHYCMPHFFNYLTTFKSSYHSFSKC